MGDNSGNDLDGTEIVAGSSNDGSHGAAHVSSEVRPREQQAGQQQQ